jgi:hypothetical protein
MENLYQPSKLLNKGQFEQIEKAFEKAWNKDTAFPDQAKDWSSENKALGQCVPTALIVYDLYGGRMIYDKKNFHFWNELPEGSEQDFTRSQFKQKTTFKLYKYKNKEEILNGETSHRTNLLSRYKLLKERFQKELNQSKY